MARAVADVVAVANGNRMTSPHDVMRYMMSRNAAMSAEMCGHEHNGRISKFCVK